MLRRFLFALFAALVAAATTMPVEAESARITVIQDMWRSLADGRSGAPRVDRPGRTWDGDRTLAAAPASSAPVTASITASVTTADPRVAPAETVNLLLLSLSLLLASRWLRRLPGRA